VIRCIWTPVSACHTIAALSKLPDSSKLVCLENLRQVTAEPWPFRVCNNCPAHGMASWLPDGQVLYVRVPADACRAVPRQLQGSCRAVAGRLQGSCRAIARLLCQHQVKLLVLLMPGSTQHRSRLHLC